MDYEREADVVSPDWYMDYEREADVLSPDWYMDYEREADILSPDWYMEYEREADLLNEEAAACCGECTECGEVVLPAFPGKRLLAKKRTNHLSQYE